MSIICNYTWHAAAGLESDLGKRAGKSFWREFRISVVVLNLGKRHAHVNGIFPKNVPTHIFTWGNSFGDSDLDKIS